MPPKSSKKRSSEEAKVTSPKLGLSIKKAKVASSPLLAPMSPRKEIFTNANALGDPSSSPISLDDEPTIGKLTLVDGTTYAGYSFGAEKPMAGEVVFNTAMVGYPEALTDPSYKGQILVLTYPLVGNYGVPDRSVMDEYGLPKYFESDTIQISGLIIADYSFDPSHWNSKSTLGSWLVEHNIPALYGIDTRMLTKKLRTHGATLGKIDFEGKVVEQTDPNKRNLVAEVSTKSVRVFNKGKSPRVLAFDCGIKYNIIRCFLKHGVEVTLVPFDHDIKKTIHEYDGVFVSNGPGDPQMAKKTVDSLRYIISLEKLVPVFGICLGNQLLALAAGAKTYKMKFGNRAMNVPVVDLRTTKCYITPQNHGFAVDDKTLPADWVPLFMNANDHSNEGIAHRFKPFFSAQFHPEANGGPTDTFFLFEEFLQYVRGTAIHITTVPQVMYTEPIVNKVLLLGSGGLSIGQAGEFDYSGSQAIKALKEENIEVILINPNIATVQTSKGLADKVYFLPVTFDYVTQVIEKERPDGIVMSMGGQTALNIGLKLYDAGILEKYNVRVLGTHPEVIRATEDREIFAEKLKEVDEKCALSYAATNVEAACMVAKKIGYPVLVRAAFALGGLGSGFAENEKELIVLAKKAFASSDQILIDQDLRGWKEVEYEVVRDNRNNCITVCNMENFDPLGIHTGDSIVVAPSQTLSNSEYHMLREVSIKVVRHLGVVGECNIQYALHPESERYCIIEVNARLSRSSALASKATGYPLAYVAAKLSLGIDLVRIKNSVTKTTTACFEPALDYCVVKVPRFDLAKFTRVSDYLGSSMKSVGEVMAIGRKFEEAIQKAVRMVAPGMEGFGSKKLFKSWPDDKIDLALKHPSNERLYVVAAALDRLYSVDKIHDLTKIDKWFLYKLQNIAQLKMNLSRFTLNEVSPAALRVLKSNGFSDKQIATGVGATELEVRKVRIDNGITPFVKQVDTLAAEYPAATNYLYITYSGSEHDVTFDVNGIIVLGCGAYCIGSSVEFDWAAVSCVRALREAKRKTVVINYNPETVSTDYDECDRLYFEELSFERVMDIYDIERAAGVIVSVGGQIANNLSLPLHKAGAKVLGTHADMILKAEDRNTFSSLLDSLNIDQPAWKALTDAKSARSFCTEVGYPVIVRPSLVLSGAGMRVVESEKGLEDCLSRAADVSPDHPVVVSKFIVDAKEIDFDGVADHGKVLNYAISEHIENAGVHSGDATLVLPAQKLYVETIRRIKKISRAIAKALNITGPFNIQLMARQNEVKVIECNLRASRSFPFISKTFDFNFISLATLVMAGIPYKTHDIRLMDIDYVAIKAPQFSFTRLHGADPTLGVEMSSTGEVACFGTTVYEAFLKSLTASLFKIPPKGGNILLSIGPEKMKESFLESAHILKEMGFKIFATDGTYEYLTSNNIPSTLLKKPSELKKSPNDNVITYLQDRKIDLTIAIPQGFHADSVTNGYEIRRTTVDFGISLVTNIQCAILLIASMQKTMADPSMLEIKCASDYYDESGVMI